MSLRENGAISWYTRKHTHISGAEQQQNNRQRKATVLQGALLSAELTQLSRTNASFYFIYFYIASIIVRRHFPEPKLKLCLLKICCVERQKQEVGQRRRRRQEEEQAKEKSYIKDGSH